MAKNKRTKKTMADGANGVALLVRMSYAQHVALSKLAEAAGTSRAKYLLRAVDRAGKVPAAKRRPEVGRPEGDA